MLDAQALDRYFTEQVVGQPIAVEMGPSSGIRREPAQGLRLHLLGGHAELLGQAARSLFAPASTASWAGQPRSEQALARARRRLLAGGAVLFLVAWSAALWWLFRQFAT
ncbi:MAG: hypothetical protein IV094_26140 [Vitreoscilla sp.]|nr:hypothetical protein [Vitreoscilla sp.]